MEGLDKMNPDTVRKYIIDAQASLDLALAELDSTNPPVETVVHTPEEFDAAYASSTIVVCGLDLVYSSPLTINKSIHIRSEIQSTARITRDEPCPKFTGGISVQADNCTLEGLEISNNKLVDIVVLSHAHQMIYRCRILGHPTQGSKRGIAGNAADLSVVKCYIDDCFGPYPGNDTQAFIAWDTPGPITLTDNYMSGGSETIMFGGADPSSEANIPSDILIQGNTITKNPAWQSQAIGVKNTLELKNARRVLIENNDIEYSWGGHGQDGFLLMLTPRNQGGTAPYSTVEDVIIRGNRFAHASGAINILGSDNNQESQRMARVLIQENEFTDLDPKKYTGSNKMIQILAGPTETTIDKCNFRGANIGSVVYFDGSPQCVELDITNNTWPHSKYGIFGSNTSVGGNPPNAWTKYVASGTLANNTEV